MVEGLGYLGDPTARRQIDSPLFEPRVTDKYRISTGSVVYYGSTTSGEMRELCDTREPYAEFTKTNGTSCLPARLRTRGYATMAVHAFHHSMFERDEWYPAVGFEKEVFGEELVKVTHRLCGNAFRGVCDADLPPIIAQEAAFSKKPKFIYWLTLNTHIPVAPGQALADFGCKKDAGIFRHVHVCEMAELWHDVFAVRVKAGARRKHRAGGHPHCRRPFAAAVVAASTGTIRARPRGVVPAHAARRRDSRKPIAKTDCGALALEMFRQLQALRLIVRTDALPV